LAFKCGMPTWRLCDWIGAPADAVGWLGQPTRGHALPKGFGAIGSL